MTSTTLQCVCAILELWSQICQARLQPQLSFFFLFQESRVANSTSSNPVCYRVIEETGINKKIGSMGKQFPCLDYFLTTTMSDGNHHNLTSVVLMVGNTASPTWRTREPVSGERGLMQCTIHLLLLSCVQGLSESAGSRTHESSSEKGT